MATKPTTPLTAVERIALQVKAKREAADQQAKSKLASVLVDTDAVIASISYNQDNWQL